MRVAGMLGAWRTSNARRFPVLRMFSTRLGTLCQYRALTRNHLGETMKKLRRLALLLVPIAAVFFWPQIGVHAQAQTGYQQIAKGVTALTYTDTTCPIGGTCEYYVTAVTAGGVESGPSSVISVLDTGGATGNILLKWQAGACPTGKNCAVPASYNVYQAPPPTPPAGFSGAVE